MKANNESLKNTCLLAWRAGVFCVYVYYPYNSEGMCILQQVNFYGNLWFLPYDSLSYKGRFGGCFLRISFSYTKESFIMLNLNLPTQKVLS